MNSAAVLPTDDPELPDLSHLTETERNRILEVLKRDERLTKRQNEKFIKLKQEIDLLESKSLDMPAEHIENATNCARCLQVFGYFFNTGELCPQCGYKVCQTCRVNQPGRAYGLFFRKPSTSDKPDWLCILCHKYNEYLMQTGEWIHLGNESRTLRNALRLRAASAGDALKMNLTGSQIIKMSLFPNNKQEILQELEQNNFKRSSLSKRFSSIKKSKSVASGIGANNDESKENYQQPTTSSAVMMKTTNAANSQNESKKATASSSTSTSLTSGQPRPRNPFFAEYATAITSTPLVNSNNRMSSIRVLAQPAATNNPIIAVSPPTATSLKSTAAGPNIERLNLRPSKAEPEAVDEDDFGSVTSSEFGDTASTASNKQPFGGASSSALSNNLNTSMNSTNKRIEQLKLDSSSSTTFSRRNVEDKNSTASSVVAAPEKISINKRMSNSLTRLVRRRSASTRNNNAITNAKNEPDDDELAQMDQVFASAREKLKSTSSSSKLSPVESNEGNSSKNRSQSENQSTTTTSKNKQQLTVTTSSSSTASITKTAQSTAGNQTSSKRQTGMAKSAMSLLDGDENVKPPREMAIDPVEDAYLRTHNTSSSALNNERFGGGGSASNYKTLPDRLHRSSSINKKTSAKKLEKAESMKSVNDTFDSNITVRGRIHLKVAYEKVSSNLSVTIHSCEYLASCSAKKETCDPYVKVYLMPGPKDKNNKRKTSTKKNTINPVYEETLRYTISWNQLNAHKLWISAWHHDKFGKNKFLGEVTIALDTAKLNGGSVVAESIWYDLEPAKQVDIMASSSCLPVGHRVLIARV